MQCCILSSLLVLLNCLPSLWTTWFLQHLFPMRCQNCEQEKLKEWIFYHWSVGSWTTLCTAKGFLICSVSLPEQNIDQNSWGLLISKAELSLLPETLVLLTYTRVSNTHVHPLSQTWWMFSLSSASHHHSVCSKDKTEGNTSYWSHFISCFLHLHPRSSALWLFSTFQISTADGLKHTDSHPPQ